MVGPALGLNDGLFACSTFQSHFEVRHGLRDGARNEVSCFKNDGDRCELRSGLAQPQIHNML
jgi:hypothetical protein